MNSAYVSLDTAREAMEVYYHSSADRSDAFLIQLPGEIATLLQNDVFKLGFRPAEHLRAMSLHLTQEDFQGMAPDEIAEHYLEEPLDQLFESSIIKKNYFRLHVTLLQSQIYPK
jgi:hypothetical protein